MLKTNSVAYLGNTEDGGYRGYVDDENFHLFVDIPGLDWEQGKEVVDAIKHDIRNVKITNLSSFESFLGDEIKKLNFPPSISLAAGFLIGNILYLRTLGDGCIYIDRSKQVVKIIEGENSASGYVKKGDIVIYTARGFIQAYGGEKNLKTSLDHKKPIQVVEDLKKSGPNDESKNHGIILVSFEERLLLIHDNNKQLLSNLQSPIPEPSAKTKLWDNMKTRWDNFYGKFRSESDKSGTKKLVTVITLVVVAAILIWSVVLGHKRKQEAQTKEKITNARTLITQKLNQANEISFLNMSRSMALLAEARQEFDKLKREIGNDKNKDLLELNQLIAASENKVVKKEEKNYEEFYDLALDNKNAEGSKFYLDGDELAILDSQNNKVFLLSLTKKSLDKIDGLGAKQPGQIALFQDDLYVFSKGEGVYKIKNGGKPDKIIEKDSEWKDVAGICIYNGNIYLLDKGSDEIYKYLVAENGYSDKRSYFGQGEAISLTDANSFAIDSSLYVGSEDNIKKFTAGVRDSFSTSYPEGKVSLDKIYTNKDLNKVYAWSKDKGAIYVLEKNGTYNKQINSEALKKAQDFIVYDEVIYTLVGSKIFKIAIR